MAITALRRFNSESYDEEVVSHTLSREVQSLLGYIGYLKVVVQITTSYTRQSYTYYANSDNSFLTEAQARSLAAEVKAAITKMVTIKTFAQSSPDSIPEVLVTNESRLCGTVCARRNGTSQTWCVDVEEYTVTYTPLGLFIEPPALPEK